MNVLTTIRQAPGLDRYLVLRGGIRLEEFWVGWLTEYLERTDG